MKTVIRFIWKNKAAVIAVVQASIEYAPKVRDYVKEQIQKFKKTNHE